MQILKTLVMIAVIIGCREADVKEDKESGIATVAEEDIQPTSNFPEALAGSWILSTSNGRFTYSFDATTFSAKIEDHPSKTVMELVYVAIAAKDGNLDYQLKSATILSNLFSTIEQYKAEARWGYDDWLIQEPKDIADRPEFPDQKPKYRRGIVYYDYFEINGDELLMGPATSAADKRPVDVNLRQPLTKIYNLN